MAEKRPAFHYDVCVACGICVQNCPVSALSLKMTGIDPQGHVYPALNTVLKDGDVIGFFSLITGG